jgi:hypothetical protein
VTSKNKDENLKKKEETILDIIMSEKDIHNESESKVNYRISINDLDKINEYMGMLHSRKNYLVFGVLINFILDKNVDPKDKKFINIIKKTKDFSNYILLEDIYSKFKLDLEEELSEEELKKLFTKSKNPNNFDIIYRFKERTSYYVVKESNIFRIDLTKTRTSTVINKIDSSFYHYEIEIECDIKDKSKLAKQVFDVIEFIIKSVQSSNFIITKSMTSKVIDEYRDILSVNVNKTNLHGRQPISLEVVHVVDYLPNRYAVTDKADGDRFFMIVIDTRCYLISTNLIVKDTGINVDKKFNKSIIDGELIFLPKHNKYLYMIRKIRSNH